MAKFNIELKANKGMFKGLANQNLLFHQAICELADNAIAASKPNSKFKVEIIFVADEENERYVNVYVADDGKGMTLDIFSKALELGESATTDSRLNEHGFGLKNSLATLSDRNSNEWTIWSKDPTTHKYLSVSGPFGPEMEIDDDSLLPSLDFLPSDVTTLVYVKVKRSYIQTVQGRGAPTLELENLRKWLLEHLGVAYRGYLDLDENTGDNSGSMFVLIGKDRVRVLPVNIPMASITNKSFQLELGGIVFPIEYSYGALDEEKREHLIHVGLSEKEKAKHYYQGNRPSQGIDIRLGKRTIATSLFDTIWRTEDGSRQLERHNKYNSFVGELRIPELPRGILSTVNNKTDFNIHDQDWKSIFDYLNENYRPPQELRDLTEKELKEKWKRMLKATNPEDNIGEEYSVWPTAVKIDVVQKKSDGRLIIYELKVGSGAPIHLYQLKMYWDGLLQKNEKPSEAILICESYNSALEQMANEMNDINAAFGSTGYNFKLATLAEKDLVR